jgi:hypothetical protein
MAKRASKAPRPRRIERQWIVYLISGKRAGRLGTVAAADCDAAIAKAIDEFGITDPERQKRVAVSPIASA